MPPGSDLTPAKARATTVTNGATIENPDLGSLLSKPDPSKHFPYANSYANWLQCMAVHRCAYWAATCENRHRYTGVHPKNKTGGQVVAGSNPVSPTEENGL
jgi:hypothetical protein